MVVTQDWRERERGSKEEDSKKRDKTKYKLEGKKGILKVNNKRINKRKMKGLDKSASVKEESNENQMTHTNKLK